MSTTILMSSRRSRSAAGGSSGLSRRVMSGASLRSVCPGQGVGGLIVVAACSVDGAEHDLVAQYELLVERVETCLSEPLLWKMP